MIARAVAAMVGVASQATTRAAPALAAIIDSRPEPVPMSSTTRPLVTRSIACRYSLLRGWSCSMPA